MFSTNPLFKKISKNIGKGVTQIFDDKTHMYTYKFASEKAKKKFIENNIKQAREYQKTHPFIPCF